MTTAACPQCRKMMKLGPADAGRQVMCVACGCSFLAPAVPDATPSSGGMGEYSRPWSSDENARATVLAHGTPMEAKETERTWLPLAVVSVIAACVVGTVLWLALRQPGSNGVTKSLPAAAPTTRPDPETEPAVAIASTEAAPPLAASRIGAAEPPHNFSKVFATEVPPGPPKSQPAETEPAVASTAPATAPSLAAALPGGTLDVPDEAPQTQPEAETRPAETQPQRAVAGRANLRPEPVPKPLVSDREIEASIRRGMHYLLSRFSSKSYWLASVEENHSGMFNHADNFSAFDSGTDGISVWALMECGASLNDPRLAPNAPLMNGLIEAYKRLPCISGPVTYAKGIRLNVLCFFNRPQDRRVILEDLQYLLRNHDKGAYGYSVRGAAALSGRIGGWTDNSNSAYGVLGVWAAAEAGYEVPLSYWSEVENYWRGTQYRGGQWSYRNTLSFEMPDKPIWLQPNGTITAGGIVALYVTHDYLDPVKFTGNVGRDPFGSSLRRALNWWEAGTNYAAPGAAGSGSLFHLVSIERVGLVSGFKYFGVHDWYREVARLLIDHQKADGSFEGVGIDDALIFLARGRHPVIMNKLRFDAEPDIGNRFWANRPRDLAGLTHWARWQLERPLNWQIVNLERDWTDWVDSPVLYIASHNALRFRPAEYHKFRSFAINGGMIFLHADGDEKTFSKWAEEFGRKLFPQYEWQDLPADHPLYTVNYRLGRRIPLRALSNGSRLLVVLSPKDIARYWHTREDKIRPDAFRLGLSLFLYAGGKRDWRNKLDTPVLPEPRMRPVQTVNLARVRYSGDWDPEPGAWDRQRKVCQFLTGYELHPRAVKWSALGADDSPLAHVTGAVRYDPTDQEIAAMRKYVEGGGVLFIDACGGSDAFAQSMRRALSLAFPNSKLRPMLPSHPLLNKTNPGTWDISKRQLRLFVTEKMGAHFGTFEILSAGKGHVVFSALDVTSGLLGTNTWGIWGWDQDYCQKFVQNLLFWTLDGQEENAEG